MKKRFLILIFVLTAQGIFSGQSFQNKKLLKKIENFKKEDFPGIKFQCLYIKKGMYETKKDFEPVEPKLESTIKTPEFLYIYEDGGMTFLNAENSKNAYLKINQKDNSYASVLFKKKDKNIILRTMSYHAIFGMGGGIGYYRQYLKVINDKIYIQEKQWCYVYSPID